MKKVFVLTAVLVLLLTAGVFAEDKFYWDDIVASPEIQYSPMQGQVSYSIVPYELWGTEQLSDGLEHTLNLQLGVVGNVQISGSLEIAKNKLLVRGNLQSHFYNTDKLDAAWRAGYYQLDQKIEFMDIHVRVGSLELLTSAELEKKLTWHNNLFFYKTLYPGPWSGVAESGVTIGLLPKLEAKVKGSLNFANYRKSVSLTTACKLGLGKNLDYIFYMNKNLGELNYQFEHVLESRPRKGSEVILQITHNTTDNFGAHDAAKLSVEQKIFDNVALKTSVDVHLTYKIHTSLNLGLSVDL